ncbi:DUF4260 domain-containing protein [uncultured Maritimibacter sp.]|uniref:DUF4260 domain-containing protein n=1 Tax=uncultured Maritimibacter sp. TaxID=991866 RepID=UPI000B2AC5A3|nr:DUF4260 domain-containing protein [uncultured Maritimibacter sp.]
MITSNRQPLDRPQILHLRAEGAAIFALALVHFHQSGAGWWLFAALILAPDLSGLGYFAGKRVGAATYNAAHSLVGPALLWIAVPDAAPFTAIWLAHIGIDRAVGYGMKSATDHRVNHLTL